MLRALFGDLEGRAFLRLGISEQLGQDRLFQAVSHDDKGKEDNANKGGKGAWGCEGRCDNGEGGDGCAVGKEERER